MYFLASMVHLKKRLNIQIIAIYERKFLCNLLFRFARVGKLNIYSLINQSERYIKVFKFKRRGKGN